MGADGQTPRHDPTASNPSAARPEDQDALVRSTEDLGINHDKIEIDQPAQAEGPEPQEEMDHESEEREHETSDLVLIRDSDVNTASGADREAEIKQIKATWKEAGRPTCTLLMWDQSECRLHHPEQLHDDEKAQAAHEKMRTVAQAKALGMVMAGATEAEVAARRERKTEKNRASNLRRKRAKTTAAALTEIAAESRQPATVAESQPAEAAVETSKPKVPTPAASTTFCSTCRTSHARGRACAYPTCERCQKRHPGECWMCATCLNYHNGECRSARRRAAPVRASTAATAPAIPANLVAAVAAAVTPSALPAGQRPLPVMAPAPSANQQTQQAVWARIVAMVPDVRYANYVGQSFILAAGQQVQQQQLQQQQQAQQQQPQQQQQQQQPRQQQQQQPPRSYRDAAQRGASRGRR